MHYDFDEIIVRANTNSMKWDVPEGALSMSIADMDFKTAPCVIDALHEKVDFGIFAYHEVPKQYFEGFQTWWSKRHQFHMDVEWMIYCSGVVPAISSIVRKLTTQGEKVLIQAPVYNVFYNSILNNGRMVISSDLKYEHGEYQIDFHDLEVKLKNPQTTLMILCNPHNPIGKVWDKKTLEKIGELCYKHHVLVISDEVHCDLCDPNVSYTPFASINEICERNSITCLSLSKAFNLAGLQSACIVVPNETLRHKVNRALNTDEIAEPNAFACEANLAALQDGEAWLLQLCDYISKNKKIAKEFIKLHIPQLKLVNSDATYLLWIECSGIFPHTSKFCEYLQEKKGLYVSNGAMFGKNSSNFIRMNIACPTDQMLEGLHRLKEGVLEYTNQYINIC